MDLAAYQQQVWHRAQLARLFECRGPKTTGLYSPWSARIESCSSQDVDPALDDFFFDSLAVCGTMCAWGSSSRVMVRNGSVTVASWELDAPCRSLSFYDPYRLVELTDRTVRLQDMTSDQALLEHNFDVQMHTTRARGAEVLLGGQGRLLQIDPRDSGRQSTLSLFQGMTVRSAAPQPAGHLLAMGVDQGVVVEDQRRPGRTLAHFALNSFVKALAWDGPKLAFGGGLDDSRLEVRNMVTGELLGSQHTGSQVTGLAFLAHGLLLSGHGYSHEHPDKGSLKVWDLSCPRPLARARQSERVLTLQPGHEGFLAGTCSRLSTVAAHAEPKNKAERAPSRFELRVR